MSVIVDLRGRPLTSTEAARAWDAGKPDLMRSNWPTQTRPADADIRHGLTSLRARARHEAQNNDHARSFLRECKVNVIGHRGIVLQSKAIRKGGRADERARDAIERAWSEWSAECDIGGRWHWIDLQTQGMETLARDGEMIFRMHDGGNRYGFQIQAMDPETLDVQLNMDAGNGNRVIMGVEVDQNHKPIAYYFCEPDQLQQSYRGRGTSRKEHKRVPAEEILHIYLPEWISQTRGVPWMATALRRMTDLNGYDESAVVASRAGASKMGFIKRGGDSLPPLDANGQPTTGLTDGNYANGQMYSEFDPGSIGTLGIDEDFVGWNPAFPHTEHGSFTKAVLRGIASGLGVSYNTLANDAEGVNFSSLRHFALTEREMWKALQGFVIRSTHARLFPRWLDAALTVGIYTNNGRRLNPARMRELVPSNWQGRRWQWVDPQKEANAAGTEIGQRTRSISSVIRERGEDPDEVWTEIQRERERLAAMGISPDDALGAMSNAGTEPEPDE